MAKGQGFKVGDVVYPAGVDDDAGYRVLSTYSSGGGRVYLWVVSDVTGSNYPFTDNADNYRGREPKPGEIWGYPLYSSEFEIIAFERGVKDPHQEGDDGKPHDYVTFRDVHNPQPSLEERVYRRRHDIAHADGYSSALKFKRESK